MTDNNKLMSQNIKDGSQLPSFLSRAQDNARKEIATLKGQLSERDQLVAKLQKQLNSSSVQETTQMDSYISEI